MLLLSIASLFLTNCKNESKNVEQNKSVNKVEITPATSKDSIKLPFEIVDFDGLKPYLNKKNDTTYVINFWATWCAPCVKELPYFEYLQDNYKSKPVEVLLVSLDFPNQYEKKLVPFLKDKNIRSKVIALDDVDQNKWINGINQDWDGAIPVTLIYNKNKGVFYKQSFSYEELEQEVKTFIN